MKDIIKYYNKRALIYSFVFATFFSFAQLIGKKIAINSLRQISFNAFDILWFLLYFITSSLIAYIIILFVNNHEQKIVRKKVHIKWFFIFSGIMFLCWIPYLLTQLPGGSFFDTSQSIKSSLGIKDYNGVYLDNWMPLLFTQFVSLFLHIGLFFTNNLWSSVIFISIAQMILFASVLGYIIYWLLNKGLKKRFIFFIIAFFSIYPIFPLWSFYLMKDILFSAVFLLFIIFIYELINKDEIIQGGVFQNKKYFIGLTIVSFLVIFLRNNSIFICFITFLIIIIAFKKYWKNLVPLFGSIILISVIIQGPIYNLFGVYPSEFRESIAVPLAQIGRTVAKNGALSANDKNEVKKYTTINKLKEYYKFVSVDNIKDHSNLDNNYLENHKLQFFKTWLSIGIKNPTIYVTAYLYQTKFMWSVFEEPYRVSFLDWEIYPENYRIDAIGFSNFTNFTINNFLNTSLFLPFYPGVLIWYVFITLLILIYKRNKKQIILIVPILALYGTYMIAAPAPDYRYCFPLLISIPLLIFFAFYFRSKT